MSELVPRATTASLESIAEAVQAGCGISTLCLASNPLLAKQGIGGKGPGRVALDAVAKERGIDIYY